MTKNSYVTRKIKTKYVYQQSIFQPLTTCYFFSRFKVHLAAGEILALVLRVSLPSRWCVIWRSCGSIWFVWIWRSLSCLFHGDYGGAHRGGVLHLPWDGRVVAVTAAAEATYTLARRLRAVHWTQTKTKRRSFKKQHLIFITHSFKVGFYSHIKFWLPLSWSRSSSRAPGGDT